MTLPRIGSFPALLAASSALVLAFACSDDESLVGGGGRGGGASTAGGGAGQGGHGADFGTGGGVQCIADLASIAIAPADSTVTLDGGPAAPVVFTVTGTFEDGSSQPIPADALAWTAKRSDDTDPGTIQDGGLAPNPSAGGVVDVEATDGCVTGATTVHFLLDVTIGDPGDPGDWNGSPVTGGDAPLIVYPSDQTRFPRNLYRTIFQWRSQGFAAFRLIYTGPNSTVTVYTDGGHGLCAGANPAAGCWEVNELAWSYIAGSNAGSTATWVVDALDPSTDPPTVRRSDSIEIGFSKEDVEGAIFYWSTTAAGVRRGRISQQDPEDYVVGKPGTEYGTDQVKCVACHVVSRDGQYLAAPTQATSGQSLWIMQVTADPPPTPLVTSIPDTDGHGFATISPDDANVVTAFNGAMMLLDRATGAKIGDIDLGGMQKGTHPDWSPLGDELVFANKAGDAPGGASLMKMPWDGTAFGAPAALLAPPAQKSNLFPMFSPNGDYIAFAQGKGGHGDVTAQLFVIDADGANEPIELVNANRVTSNQMTNGQYQNSQPTWAPPGDLHWIAFNTKREYGVISPAGTQQIWIAAVDPDKAGNGEDPSYPAFRVPFQGLEENNHRAFWTLDVGQGGGGEGGAGGGDPGCGEIIHLGQPCDPVQDCCEQGSYCDTLDDGATYECVSRVPT